jgi:hypothetical protein
MSHILSLNCSEVIGQLVQEHGCKAALEFLATSLEGCAVSQFPTYFEGNEKTRSRVPGQKASV